MTNFFKIFSAYDVFMLAVAAFIITSFTRSVMRFITLFKDETRFVNNPSEFRKAMEKCYSLFPLEIIKFKGEEFKRGLHVRIKTVSSKIIEGMIIGMNEDNIVCVITRTYISAEILDNISEITPLEQPLIKP